ncbi:23660_t:CDS:2, partial [Gigaspora margarita]
NSQDLNTLIENETTDSKMTNSQEIFHAREYKNEYQCCYNEKTIPKKFSVANNMDPDEILKELKDLTNIKEMLIAQVFPIISVYNLHGGQYAYREHIINFSQDLQEFVTCLPCDSASLDVLVVRHSSTNGTAFRDFNDYRKK